MLIKLDSTRKPSKISLVLQLPCGSRPEAWNKLLHENIHTNLGS